MRNLFAGAVAAIALLGARPLFAQEQDPPAVPQTEPGTFGDSPTAFNPNQPLRPGFQISVNTEVGGAIEADSSGTFTVDPAGAIIVKPVTMPINVKGLTPSQAADKIAAALKPYIKDPKVTVSILQVPRPTILLSGGVNRSGATPVNDNTTLAELLTVIGFNENADLSKIRVTRRDDNDERSTKEYNFLKWLKPAPGQLPDETQNPLLVDRDFVHVSLKVFPGTGLVTVEGAVERPGVVDVRVGVPMLLREVFTLSGGVQPSASRFEIAIRRIGVERPIIVNYDKMEAGDPLHNIEVRADDVIYVPTLGPDLFVSMIGAFVKPGKLPYVRSLTLSQAVSEVGGIQLAAKDHEGRIFRHPNNSSDPTKTQIIRFDYRHLRDSKQPDILLEPGDTVEIQQGRPPGTEPSLIQTIQTVIGLALSFEFLFGGGRRR